MSVPEDYRFLYETMAEGVVHRNADGAIISANPAALSILGLTLDQITGRASPDPPLRTIHEDGSDFPAETHPWTAALKTGRPVRNIRMGVYNATGTGLRWFNVVATPRFRPGEEVSFQVFETYRDVTDRLRAEAALAESEAKYRALVDTAGVGVATVDPEGRLSYANPALCEMFGRTRDELAGVSLTTFIHPEDAGRIARHFADAIRTNRVDATLEFRAIHRDGHVIHLQANPTVSQYQGRVTGVSAIIRDVTEIMRMEHALQSRQKWFEILFNSVSDAVYVHVFEAPDGLPGKFIEVNDMACRRLGYSREELLGMRVQEIDAPETLAAVPAIMEKLRREKTAVWEGVHVRKDGVRIEVEISNRLIDLEGTPVIFSTVRDVTERKRVEKELNGSHLKLRNLAQHLLHAREEERKTVAQEIHDELGQVLTALKMDFRWLERQLESSPERVREKIQGMTALTDQTIQRVQRISSDLRPRMLDDLGLAAAIEWLMGDFSRRTGIRCKTSVRITESRIGGNSAVAIFRIIQEVLTNVARHAKASRVSLQLSEADERLEILVRDDGIGITEAQASDARSYGLIGIRERAQGLGGNVSIHGETGKGATVAVSIPYPAGGNLA
jgi:PAS domain S-box-containing protein